MLLLALPLAAELELELELELAATCAASFAGVGLVVAEALPVAVTLAVPVAGGVPDGDVDGEFVALAAVLTMTGGGALAPAEWLGDAPAELVEGDGEGEGDGDGDGEGDSDPDGEGDGDGVGVAEAGSAWHTVSVLFAVAAGAASALPSTPRVRKLPLSKVTAATLTCAKRIKNRPSTLLVRFTVCSS